jgi:hypothetical protein
MFVDESCGTHDMLHLFVDSSFANSTVQSLKKFMEGSCSLRGKRGTESLSGKTVKIAAASETTSSFSHKV